MRISNAFVDVDGLIDLVLCSTHEDDSSSIRLLIKTEQAESVLTGSGKLLEPQRTSTSPANDAELDMLEHHRLNWHSITVLWRRWRHQGQKDSASRRPAILVGVSGRRDLSEEMLPQHKRTDRTNSSSYGIGHRITVRIPKAESEAHICKICPFSRGVCQSVDIFQNSSLNPIWN